MAEYQQAIEKHQVSQSSATWTPPVVADDCSRAHAARLLRLHETACMVKGDWHMKDISGGQLVNSWKNHQTCIHS